ncbi:MAG: DNA polymerase III subunit epsilon [Hyphomonadaceae bacterium]|nr:DNA polymerase III subunit epsilon [Hyphomonadaceae bacterium]
MREIVFDTETTGRDPLLGDRIVEIACVEIVNLLPTGATFHRYVNPERDVPEEVVKVHGLTGAFLRDKPVFGAPDVIGPLLDFIGDSPLVAHNAEFDRKFLNAELVRLERTPFAAERFVDTLPIARALFPGAANSLDALSRRFQLDRYGFDLAKRKGAGGHGALLDARMLAEVYLQLRGGRERKLAFEDASAGRAATDQGAGFKIVRRPTRARALAPRITPAEAAAHAAFVAELGEGALWNAPADPA